MGVSCVFHVVRPALKPARGTAACGTMRRRCALCRCTCLASVCAFIATTTPTRGASTCLRRHSSLSPLQIRFLASGRCQLWLRAFQQRELLSVPQRLFLAPLFLHIDSAFCSVDDSSTLPGSLHRSCCNHQRMQLVVQRSSALLRKVCRGRSADRSESAEHRSAGTSVRIDGVRMVRG